MPSQTWKEEIGTLYRINKNPCDYGVTLQYVDVTSDLIELIETQIQKAREEVIKERMEQEKAIYEQGKLDGRAEMKAQCLAVLVLPEDGDDKVANMYLEFARRIVQKFRNSISSL